MRLAVTKGMSKASLARSAGRSRSYVTEIFKGKKVPAPDTAVLLAETLGASKEDLASVREWAEQVQEQRHDRDKTAARPSTTAASSPDRWAICMAYLEALDGAHNRLRAVALTERPGDLLAMANTAMEGAGVYTQRDRLLASGAPDVVAAGEAAFFDLVNVRNVIRTGAALASPAYHAVYHPFAEKLWHYRLAVRAEFGGQPFTPRDVHREDWSDRDRCAECGLSASETDGA
ncbi:helix-turn-helix domain-containing protein [Actinoplanes sp. CA-252034]|uniref:helix-turn-helix domain-containing protein n=1 Tax=Actinoplanes sp. CA-252034 TaxID=3239906 RepID=UPI003D95E93E